MEDAILLTEDTMNFGPTEVDVAEMIECGIRPYECGAYVSAMIELFYLSLVANQGIVYLGATASHTGSVGGVPLNPCWI